MIEIKAKLWLEKDDKFIIGHGRARLLRMIQEKGSLVKAAGAMKMSYSHAWSEVRKISLAAGEPVVKTIRGGKSGGSTSLTAAGEEILKKYDAEQKSLIQHLARQNEKNSDNNIY